MTSTSENFYIKKCLQAIESKLGWGDSSSWTNYDFEKLSDAIYTETSIRLSLTTLKRLWGKLTYNSAPTVTTLNTLAKFSGYDDWRSFKLTISSIEHNPAIKPRKIKHPAYWITLLIAVLVLSYFGITGNTGGKTEKLDPSLFRFEANKVITEGVPNSVVFHYDASAANTDSVFIVQTWDISRKKLVSRNKHDHSAIYYYPGFFRTKLIAGNQVLKTHDLWITSNDWLCLAEASPIPVYFKKEEYLKGDRVEIDRKTLEKYSIPLYPIAPRLRFYNQRDLGDLMNDNFTFETKIKSQFNDGAGACQYVQVLIQCKDDIIIIPLAAPPCVGNLSLLFAGYEVQSANSNLSKFGCDLTQWTSLKIETVDKRASILVNNELAHTLVFPNEATGIVGVQIRFPGEGAVKETRFTDKDKVYEFDIR